MDPVILGTTDCGSEIGHPCCELLVGDECSSSDRRETPSAWGLVLRHLAWCTLNPCPRSAFGHGQAPCAIVLCVALSRMCALSAGLVFPEPGCLPGPSDVAWLPLVTCVQENCVVFALPEGCCLLAPL